MQETWVNLYCNSCDESWESDLSDLPKNNRKFECKSCGHESPVKEFLHSERDLEIYEEFN